MKYLIAIILLGGTAHAQSFGYVKTKMLPDAEHPAIWSQDLPVPHRTADKAFWLLTAVNVGLTVLDAENTAYIMRSGGNELNPVLGKHPNRLRLYGFMMPVTAYSIYRSYREKREDDARIAAGYKADSIRWWVPQLLVGGGHGIAVGVSFALSGR